MHSCAVPNNYDGDNSSIRVCRECGDVYKKEKNMDKGIAFPTCLSVDQ